MRKGLGRTPRRKRRTKRPTNRLRRSRRRSRVLKYSVSKLSEDTLLLPHITTEPIKLKKKKKTKTKKQFKDAKSKKQKSKKHKKYTPIYKLPKKGKKSMKQKKAKVKQTKKKNYKKKFKMKGGGPIPGWGEQVWDKDTRVLHCRGCKKEFGFFLKKHHCRLCGKVFCADCSNYWVTTDLDNNPLPLGGRDGFQRACNDCYQKVSGNAPEALVEPTWPEWLARAWLTRGDAKVVPPSSVEPAPQPEQELDGKDKNWANMSKEERGAASKLGRWRWSADDEGEEPPPDDDPMDEPEPETETEGGAPAAEEQEGAAAPPDSAAFTFADPSNYKVRWENTSLHIPWADLSEDQRKAADLLGIKETDFGVVNVSFEDEKLGIGFLEPTGESTSNLTVGPAARPGKPGAINPKSAAAADGVPPLNGAIVVSIGAEDVREISDAEVLQKLKGTPRPMIVGFWRPGYTATPAPPGTDPELPQYKVGDPIEVFSPKLGWYVARVDLVDEKSGWLQVSGPGGELRLDRGDLKKVRKEDSYPRMRQNSRMVYPGLEEDFRFGDTFEVFSETNNKWSSARVDKVKHDQGFLAVSYVGPKGIIGKDVDPKDPKTVRPMEALILRDYKVDLTETRIAAVFVSGGVIWEEEGAGLRYRAKAVDDHDARTLLTFVRLNAVLGPARFANWLSNLEKSKLADFKQCANNFANSYADFKNARLATRGLEQNPQSQIKYQHAKDAKDSSFEKLRTELLNLFQDARRYGMAEP